jgi:tyrosyl-tRNA synthetase
MPQVTLAGGEDGLPVAQMLKQAGLTASTTEAVRMIEQGGVRLDGARLEDRALRIARGRTVVAQVGKRKVARITVT